MNYKGIMYCSRCDGVFKKILSKTANPVFKGDHWYATEYGNQRYNKKKSGQVKTNEEVDIKSE